jgi:hypothetical protein
MSDEHVSAAEDNEGIIRKTIREVTQPFIDLVHASRALEG